MPENNTVKTSIQKRPTKRSIIKGSLTNTTITHPLVESHPAGLAAEVPYLPVTLLRFILVLLPLLGGEGCGVLLALLRHHLRTVRSTAREFASVLNWVEET